MTAPLKIERGQIWQAHFGSVIGRSKATGEYVCRPEPWGTGIRWIIILAAGGKWITGMDEHTGHVAKIHVDDWTPQAGKLDSADPRKAVRRIVRRRRILKQHGIWNPPKYATALIRALERSLKP